MNNSGVMLRGRPKACTMSLRSSVYDLPNTSKRFVRLPLSSSNVTLGSPVATRAPILCDARVPHAEHNTSSGGWNRLLKNSFQSEAAKFSARSILDGMTKLLARARQFSPGFARTGPMSGPVEVANRLFKFSAGSPESFEVQTSVSE
jgi:hypothetical protein